MNIQRLTVAGLLGVATSAWGQSFYESGATGTFLTSHWVVDRYAPAGWTSGAMDPLGGQALRIDISNADRADLRPPGYGGVFYNTQGRQRSTSISAPWEIGGALFIPTSWGQAGNLRRSDLWARDANPTEANAHYPIVGFINNDPAAPFDPTATNFQPRFRVWNSGAGWVDLTEPIVYDDYNTFRIVSTGSAFLYYVNGSLVHTGAYYSQGGYEALQTVFVQAYNFGDSSNTMTLPDSSYSAYWRNVYAVPSPGAMALLGLGGMLAGRRRRG